MKSQAPGSRDFARGKKVTVSSFVNPYFGAHAVSGIISEGSRWVSDWEPNPHWMVIDLGEKKPVGQLVIYASMRSNVGPVSQRIQFWLEGRWTDAQIDRILPGRFIRTHEFNSSHYLFKTTEATSRVRIIWDVLESQPIQVSVWGVELYEPGVEPETPVLLRDPKKGAHYDEGTRGDHDPDVRVIVSQFGYHPDHTKRVIYKFNGTDREYTFSVIRKQDGTVAFSGKLKETVDDFGCVKAGDFTGLTEEGEFYVSIGPHRSFGTFSIKRHLWDNLQRYIAMYYFGLRRIGEDNVMADNGDLRQVKWDDSRTADGGYRYIGKSFCDGNDTRRYANVSLIVAQYCLLKQREPFWDRSDWIYEQVRWGLDGVLTFLGKDGLLEIGLHCGENVMYGALGSDGIANTGDESLVIDPFDEELNWNEYNSLNKELIYTSVLLGPAEAILTFRDKDPVFFDRCLKLVESGYGKIMQMYGPFPFKYSLSAWIWLNAVLYKITGKEAYRNRAILEADRFLQLQQTEPLGDESGSLSGWYRYVHETERDPWADYTPRFGGKPGEAGSLRNPWGEKAEQEVMVTPWIYQGLFRLVELLPGEERAAQWKESIRRYARDFLLASSKWNVYGLTPMKVGANGLARRRGTLSYQYFAEIGRMFHQLGNGAYLMKAARLLSDSELEEAAWRHGHYYTGCNPLGIGCIYGLSSNIPSQQYFNNYTGKAYPGGMPNGFRAISLVNDYPVMHYWEYYGYSSLAVLWFATEIGSERFDNPIELWPRELLEAPHTAQPDLHPRHRFPLRMKGGFTYRFMAIIRDKPDGVIEWSVNGVPGGCEEYGFISDDGVYTAPVVREEMNVAVKAALKGNPSVFETTSIRIMPVPSRVEGFTCRQDNDKRVFTWQPVTVNCSGYTIWRRYPVQKGRIGTIFEKIAEVSYGTVQYVHPQSEPPGTEFLVRAYYRTGKTIYGYGHDSAIITL